MEISQNFVAFSEYMNFILKINHFVIKDKRFVIWHSQFWHTEWLLKHFCEIIIGIKKTPFLFLPYFHRSLYTTYIQTLLVRIGFCLAIIELVLRTVKKINPVQYISLCGYNRYAIQGVCHRVLDRGILSHIYNVSFQFRAVLGSQGCREKLP